VESRFCGVYGWLDVHRVGVAIPFAMEYICSGDDEEPSDEGGIHQSGSRLLLLEAFFCIFPFVLFFFSGKYQRYLHMSFFFYTFAGDI
jgi:hypothetical protein